MNVLSRIEIDNLLNSSSHLKKLFKDCVLAVINAGSNTNDGVELCDRYPTFDVKIIHQERGIKLQIINAPAHSFVEGKLIEGIKQNIFSVLRDVIYTNTENKAGELTSKEITNEVFRALRNANVLKSKTEPNLVVAWGGHTINPIEYEYCKEVGYHLGLRGLNIITGSGLGVMEASMVGASIAHAKQRINNGIYLGITEPGIVSSESPNTLINQLVIMNSIERRLEAFVRVGHGVIIFPGGAGTCEELLFLLGVLLHPDNKNIPFPLILAGDESSREYFEKIDEFILATLGREAAQHYKIIIGDPELVAHKMAMGIKQVKDFRKEKGDAYYYNWLLKIEKDFQTAFEPTHANMLALNLFKDQPINLLAANLRRAFSGIVSGNVKESGVKQIEELGHFELHGDLEIMELMDALLSSFVKSGRMKLRGSTYVPCYKIIK
jgi:predicted Rossmann-fold nucleotide-binding protein